MTKTKKIMLIMLSFILMIGVFYKTNTLASAEDDDNQVTVTEDYFTVLDKEGNVKRIEFSTEEEITPVSTEPETYQVVKQIGDYQDVIGEYDTYEEAAEVYQASKRQRSVGDVMIMSNDAVRTVDYGIVRFRNKGNDTTSYKEVDTNRNGYFYPGTAADGAYISTSADGNTIRVKVAGVVMDVAASDVMSIEPYTDSSWCSSYIVENGVLYHESLYWNGSSYKNLSYARIGFGLSYLKSDVDYYSYDGHYFYSDYKTMINDYRNGNYNNAVNANNPYYSYYQYLSHRTITNYSASQFNTYLDTNIAGKRSALTSQAQAFINTQNNYTSNAGLMLGVSINESGWGTSNYAINRNNLFGHQAYDSDPDQATVYGSAEESVNNHATSYVNGYLNAIDSRYRGPHLGDKRSGMNVKYASDAYWGEKAASHLYKLASTSGNKSDYGKYTIGILNVGEQWFYKEANPSTAIYSSATTDGAGKDQVYDFPVTILGKVTGTDGQTWYKIVSDTPLTSNRSQISPSSTYSSSRDYVYIPASSVGYLSGSVSGDSGFVLGDVNGNGRIDAADYLMIMDTILGKYTMSESQKKAGDVNKNGKIDAADYLMIMDCILGKITIN